MPYRRKLDTRTVLSLRPDPGGKKDVFVWDTQIPGFGIRIKPSGAAAWFYQYRNEYRRTRRYKIGKAGAGGLTAKQARDEVLKLQGKVKGGDDPAAERKGRRTAQTVGELADEWLLAGHNSKKPNTLINDKSRVDAHIRPLLGAVPIASLTSIDVSRFYRKVLERTPDKSSKTNRTRGGKAAASKAVDALKAILQRAVDQGVIEKNPAQGLKLKAPEARKVPFSFGAVSRVGQAMRELQAEGLNETGLNALRFLLLSGFRRMEALSLQWGDLDERGQCVNLRDSKTGAQTRPVGSVALDHLLSFKPRGAKSSDYVFTAPSQGGSKKGHLTGSIKTHWSKISERAGLDGVTIHGLRHWFGSAAAELNFSDLSIAALLGHSLATVTSRYAVAPDEVFRMAADKVSQALADALELVSPKQ